MRRELRAGERLPWERLESNLYAPPGEMQRVHAASALRALSRAVVHRQAPVLGAPVALCQHGALRHSGCARWSSRLLLQQRPFSRARRVCAAGTSTVSPVAALQLLDLPTKCPGCGVKLQAEDANLPGYARAIFALHMSSGEVCLVGSTDDACAFFHSFFQMPKKVMPEDERESGDASEGADAAAEVRSSSSPWPCAQPRGGSCSPRSLPVCRLVTHHGPTCSTQAGGGQRSRGHLRELQFPGRGRCARAGARVVVFPRMKSFTTGQHARAANSPSVEVAAPSHSAHLCAAAAAARSGSPQAPGRLRALLRPATLRARYTRAPQCLPIPTAPLCRPALCPSSLRPSCQKPGLRSPLPLCPLQAREESAGGVAPPVL